MIAVHEFYPNLEHGPTPGHQVIVDADGYQWAVCDFNRDLYRTPWAPTANPEEVGCGFCEYLDGATEWAGPTHICGLDEPPTIQGGAHGQRHHVTEWQHCQIPLRRVSWCGITTSMHEGMISKLAPVDAEYHQRVAAGDPWRVRQADTGFYNCRKISGSSSWSKHSWAVAVDVNWNSAPYGTRRRDHPAWFTAAITACGMGDGINWKTPDPMHYSAWPSEGGDGWLYVGPTTQPTQETRMIAYLTGNGQIWVTDGIFHAHVTGPAHWEKIKPHVPYIGGPQTQEFHAQFVEAKHLFRQLQAWHGMTHQKVDTASQRAEAARVLGHQIKNLSNPDDKLTQTLTAIRDALEAGAGRLEVRFVPPDES